MAAPVILQHGSAASSSAAPATFAGTFGTPSTAGTCLVVLYAAAMSGAGSVGTPASWLNDATASNSNTAILIGVNFYNNNPGGVTGTGSLTLTNVNGIAVAWYEISGLTIPAMSILHRVDRVTLGNSTAPATATSITPASANSVYVALIAHIGQTLTFVGVPASGLFGAWVADDTATSTVGATNVTAHSYHAYHGQRFPDGGVLQPSGTLGAGTNWAVNMIGLPAVESGPLASATAEGGLGMVSGGAGYAIGG